MFQVRVHGRGGQGVVTTAELLSVAAFAEGRHAQAFPSFGSERTGAPVVAFCRLDDRPIRIREPIARPDAVIVQDATLLHQADVFAGLAEDGYLLLNTSLPLADLGIDELVHRLGPGHLLSIPATELAVKRLGRPLPGAALLAGFAVLTRRILLTSVESAIHERFGGSVAEGNVLLAREAYDLMTRSRKATTDA
jgi:pyruvate ferredoxin oxidoreductase gamma subunit